MQRLRGGRCARCAPGAKALRGAADHHGIGFGVFQHGLGFFRRSDVAIGNYRNTGLCFYRRNRFVFRIAGIGTGTGATMDGQRLDAGVLGDL